MNEPRPFTPTAASVGDAHKAGILGIPMYDEHWGHRLHFDSVEPRDAWRNRHWTPAIVTWGDGASMEIEVRRSSCGLGCMCGAEFRFIREDT